MKTKLTRRQLLQAGLGASQVALLGSWGLLGSNQARANSGADRPTRLLTIWVDGGWMPAYAFCPLSPEVIRERLPQPGTSSGEPIFFTPEQLRNLDGSGDALDPDDPSFQRLRVPHMWDEEALSAGMGDGRDQTSPHMWAYREYGLHENLSVVHGVDMKTAAHKGGLISAMCGAAGASYRAPAIHSVVGARFYDRYKDTRPLPVVSLGQAPVPVPLNMAPNGSPSVLSSLNDLQYSLSERPDLAWENLRHRKVQDVPDFRRAIVTPVGVNEMDTRVLDRIRGMAGNANKPTDAFMESMFDMYKGVSSQLAQDIITAVSQQKGWEHQPHPHWVNPSWSPYGIMHGRGISSDSGSGYATVFDLALQLMKADVTSSISIGLRGQGNYRFDAHGDGHPGQFLHNRSLLDCIGRFLGELKATPIGGGRTMLDDTQVLIFSEFARTWPTSGTCDHWPITSTIFAGGCVQPNRMIGNYDFTGLSPRATGPNGAPISIVDEGETDPKMRPPTSADVVYTALHGLGIDDHFIPGGAGTIQGVLSS